MFDFVIEEERIYIFILKMWKKICCVFNIFAFDANNRRREKLL